MIYEFYDLFDENKKVIVENFENSITIHYKDGGQVTRITKTSDDFKSEFEFLDYAESVLEKLFENENMIFGVNPHMN